MADNATNEESQMGTWESDTVIVLLIPGNAGVGKDGTRVGPDQGKHPLYTGICDVMKTQLVRIRKVVDSYQLSFPKLPVKSRVR